MRPMPRRVPRPRRARPTSSGASIKTTPVNIATGTVTTQKTQTYTLSRREKIGEIVTQGTSNKTYVINARNPNLAEWLSNIASSYDMYYFNKLVFEYMPSTNATVSGTIVMAIDYDVTDDNADTSFENLTAYSGAVSGQVYTRMSCTLNPSCTVMPMHKYFCAASGADRLNDMGRLIVKVVSSLPVGTRMGDLFMDYTVTFYDPEKPPTSLPVEASLTSKSSSLTPITSGVTNSTVFGGIPNMSMRVQNAIKATTSIAVNYAQPIGDAVALLCTAYQFVSKTFLAAKDPRYGINWRSWDPANEEWLDIAFAAVPGEVLELPPGRGGDYLVVWDIRGTFTATDPQAAPSPVLRLTGTNVQIFGGYQTPSDPSEEPLMYGNNFRMVGFYFVQIANFDAPAALSYEVSGENGNWTAIQPMYPIGNTTVNSHFTVVPAPHCFTGNYF